MLKVPEDPVRVHGVQNKFELLIILKDCVQKVLCTVFRINLNYSTY